MKIYYLLVLTGVSLVACYPPDRDNREAIDQPDVVGETKQKRDSMGFLEKQDADYNTETLNARDVPNDNKETAVQNSKRSRYKSVYKTCTSRNCFFSVPSLRLLLPKIPRLKNKIVLAPTFGEKAFTFP